VDIDEREGCRAGLGGFAGGLAGALPFALKLELVLKSKTSWLPAFITGLGVEGMGGFVK
jgi:hypothetical protein